jgi:hypothetical protein
VITIGRISSAMVVRSEQEADGPFLEWVEMKQAQHRSECQRKQMVVANWQSEDPVNDMKQETPHAARGILFFVCNIVDFNSLFCKNDWMLLIRFPAYLAANHRSIWSTTSADVYGCASGIEGGAQFEGNIKADPPLRLSCD